VSKNTQKEQEFLPETYRNTGNMNEVNNKTEIKEYSGTLYSMQKCKIIFF